MFEDNKRMSVNIHNKKGAEEQLKLTELTLFRAKGSNF